MMMMEAKHVLLQPAKGFLYCTRCYTADDEMV